MKILKNHRIFLSRSFTILEMTDIPYELGKLGLQLYVREWKAPYKRGTVR